MLPFPLADVERVEFYKRDELTTDLICCEVAAGDAVYRANEESPGWAELVETLETLPGFESEWFAKVSQPPFEEARTVVFERR